MEKSETLPDDSIGGRRSNTKPPMTERNARSSLQNERQFLGVHRRSVSGHARLTKTQRIVQENAELRAQFKDINDKLSRLIEYKHTIQHRQVPQRKQDIEHRITVAQKSLTFYANDFAKTKKRHNRAMNPDHISDLTLNHKVLKDKIEKLKHENQVIKSGQWRNALQLKQAKESGENVDVAVEYERMTVEIVHLKAKLLKANKKTEQIANSTEIMNKRWEEVQAQEKAAPAKTPKAPTENPPEVKDLSMQMLEVKRTHGAEVSKVKSRVSQLKCKHQLLDKELTALLEQQEHIERKMGTLNEKQSFGTEELDELQQIKQETDKKAENERKLEAVNKASKGV